MWQTWPLYFLSPFVLALLLWALSLLCVWRGRRRLGLALGSVGFLGLWFAATPLCANLLLGPLEARYPAQSPAETPAADAIVILGGSVAGAQPPVRHSLGLSASSVRVLHAAALYRAGKARWIVIAAGNRPSEANLQPEAEAIAVLLGQLGVPATAIRSEARSRTTRENAANIRPLLEGLGARRVLLVTSAFHMPRAMATFVRAYPPPQYELVPAATDVRAGATADPLKLWFPSLGALGDVTVGLKEIAGIAALTIIP